MTYRETQEVIERFLAFWTEEGDRGDHWPPFRSFSDHSCTYPDMTLEFLWIKNNQINASCVVQLGAGGCKAVTGVTTMSSTSSLLPGLQYKTGVFPLQPLNSSLQQPLPPLPGPQMSQVAGSQNPLELATFCLSGGPVPSLPIIQAPSTCPLVSSFQAV